jgi:formamidopyrimidine-DNA glycosylase
MPELPEVEALAGFLREHVTGHGIAAADVAAVSVLKTYDPPPAALTGLIVTGVTRHGKFLDLRCDRLTHPAHPDQEHQPLRGAHLDQADHGPQADQAEHQLVLHLVFHLARAGWLRWRDELPPRPPRPGKGVLAFRLRLDDGSGFELTEAGTRKRLAVYVVRDPCDVPGVASLGPDPLDPAFTATALGQLLAGRRTQIKGVLRDQHLIAGIGNAYSDEVLHAARMSPFKLASSVTPAEVEALHAAILSTVGDAVARSAGVAAGELKNEKKTGMRVHGRAGQPCPVCGDTVREVSFADSALQYCPTCQTGGKPLADRRLSRLLK